MEIQDDPPAGVPEWVVTYGDMMSLLLTFFIMLVSLSEVKADDKYRAVLEAIQQYLGYSAGPLAPPGVNFPLNSLIDSKAHLSLGSFTNQSLGYGGVRRKGLSGTDSRIYRLREGEKILVNAPIVFQDAAVELDPSHTSSFHEIVKAIAGKPQKIELQALAGQTAEDRTLTYDERMRMAYERARNVQLEMEAMGINHQRFRICLVPERMHSQTTDHIAEFSSHRVDVYLLDEYASEFVGRAEDYQ